MAEQGSEWVGAGDGGRGELGSSEQVRLGGTLSPLVPRVAREKPQGVTQSLQGLRKHCLIPILEVCTPKC